MPAIAEIITIGDEILYGQTLDTNSHWMSAELDKAGITVRRKTTIGDVREEILAAIKQAETRADIILITGGLGPTNDDLTKPCLIEYFNTKLVRHQEIIDHISNLFERVGRSMSDLNQQQADLPEACKPIQNEFGTAPGMWFDKDEKVIISMPGVPYEMQKMMSDSIIPALSKQFVEEVIHHKMIRTIGIPESKLAEIIKGWEAQLPQDIKLAYLPTMGLVKLRLTSRGKEEKKVKDAVQAEVDKVLPLIEKYVFGFDDDEIEEVIGRLLKSQGKKLAVAESCTGGYLSHKITSVPGSSEWFSGALVPYSNQLKNEQLGVSQEILNTHGAVSEPVVLALAENVRKAFQTDVAVSISGIAGPGGGSKNKPVGTVWIGYSDKQQTIARKFQFTKDRNLNIQFSALTALNMIRINLDKN